MKIAYIAVKGIPMSGGIEKYTEEMAKKLVERGHEVTVYTTKHYGNTTGIYDKFYVRAVPSLKGKFFEKITLVMVASIDQLFRDYDIVHYHALGPSIFAFMAKLRGRKVVIQSHGIEYQRAKWGPFASSVLKLLERFSYNMGDALTVVSRPIRNYFQETYNKESFFIPTGVELPDFRQYSEDDFLNLGLRKDEYYLFIARIVEEKGLHYLIDAYKKVNTQKKLVIVGKMEKNNPYHQKLWNMAQEDNRVVFLGEAFGERKDMLFRGAFSFCLPSEIEGMSIALLEAMSYRKLCIVSDIPENKDVAQGKAIFFESKNIDDLQRAIENVESASKEKLDQYRENAMKYVMDCHQFGMVANQMEKLYFNILEKGNGKSI